MEILDVVHQVFIIGVVTFLYLFVQSLGVALHQFIVEELLDGGGVGGRDFLLVKMEEMANLFIDKPCVGDGVRLGSIPWWPDTLQPLKQAGAELGVEDRGLVQDVVLSYYFADVLVPYCPHLLPFIIIIIIIIIIFIFIFFINVAIINYYNFIHYISLLSFAHDFFKLYYWI